MPDLCPPLADWRRAINPTKIHAFALPGKPIVEISVVSIATGPLPFRLLYLRQKQCALAIAFTTDAGGLEAWILSKPTHL